MSEQNPDRGEYEASPAADGDPNGVDGQQASAVGDDVAELSGRADWQRQLEDQREKHLRLAAEYENFRKRSAKERQEAGWRAQAALVKGLIEALDDLARFAHVDPATTDAPTVVQGVDMVEKKMLKSLGGHGLEVINPVDHPFDPALHEAVATEPALSAEDDHMVARVYQSGYLFNGQLLRPARVVVKQWNG
jgi:molecular chaperone GrpE